MEVEPSTTLHFFHSFITRAALSGLLITTVLLTFFSSRNSWKILLLLLLVQCRRNGASLKECTLPDITPNTTLSTAEELWGSLVPHIVHLNGVRVRRLETRYLSGKTYRLCPSDFAINLAACLNRDFSIHTNCNSCCHLHCECGYWLHFYIFWSFVTVFTSLIYRFSLQFSLVHVMAVGTGSSSACDSRVCFFNSMLKRNDRYHFCS